MLPPLQRDLQHLTVTSISPKSFNRSGRHPVYNKLRSPKQANRQQQSAARNGTAPHLVIHTSKQASSSKLSDLQEPIEQTILASAPAVRLYSRAQRRTGSQAEVNQQAPLPQKVQGHADERLALHQGSLARAGVPQEYEAVTNPESMGGKAVMRRQSSRNKGLKS